MTSRALSGTQSADHSADRVERTAAVSLRPSGSDESPPGVLHWRIHPARQRAGTTVAVLGVIAALTALTVHLMGSLWWGLLPILFFLLTLQRFFFPTEYRLDDEGVSMHSAWTSQKLPWNDIRRFHADDEGAYLSPRSRPSLLDSFQGMHLLFDNSDKARAKGCSGSRVRELLTDRLDKGKMQRQSERRKRQPGQLPSAEETTDAAASSPKTAPQSSHREHPQKEQGRTHKPAEEQPC